LTVLDVSVVVPARNAEAILDQCLRSVRAQRPRELIVVDGLSTDRTVEIAREHGATVVSDEGRGLPAARELGARLATSRRVALIDADVLLPDDALAALLAEFEADGYTGLQAGLHSIGGRGYWSRALAHHHRTGRSKHWFGLVATIFEREALLRHGFDAAFLSGEDIELRRRLRRAGARVAVSSRTVVVHRFDDGFGFARSQWLADGAGLKRLWDKEGWRGLSVVALPLAAALRGMALSIGRLQPQWVPYYGCYMVFNYVGMFGRR
jgi:glycosyltransferase involved in cell wall biosynthesis